MGELSYEWMIQTKLLCNKKELDRCVNYSSLNWVERRSIATDNYLIDLHFKVASTLHRTELMSSIDAYKFTIFCAYMITSQITHMVLKFNVGEPIPNGYINAMYDHIADMYDYPKSMIDDGESESNSNSPSLSEDEV